jgi:hypothetical protein
MAQKHRFFVNAGSDGECPRLTILSEFFKSQTKLFCINNRAWKQYKQVNSKVYGLAVVIDRRFPSVARTAAIERL